MPLSQVMFAEVYLFRTTYPPEPAAQPEQEVSAPSGPSQAHHEHGAASPYCLMPKNWFRAATNHGFGPTLLMRAVAPGG
jgi:hypothetical protein